MQILEYPAAHVYLARCEYLLMFMMLMVGILHCEARLLARLKDVTSEHSPLTSLQMEGGGAQIESAIPPTCPLRGPAYK